MHRIFIKKCFLLGGTICRVNRFTMGSRTSLKGVRKSQMMPNQVALLRLRQKQLCSEWKSSRFRRTGKAMGQVYQCWWSLCRKINVFSRFKYHMFNVLHPFVTYLLTLSCICWVILVMEHADEQMHTHTFPIMESPNMTSMAFRAPEISTMYIH
jgi:hypothetical protein